MKKIFKIITAVIFAGLSFVSCNNDFSLDLQHEETKKAYLSFAINEGIERKVIPVELTWNEVDSIKLTKDGEELKTWKTSAEKSAYNQMKADNSITMNCGKYDFAITLKDKNGNLLQSGKLNAFEIKEGENLLSFETKACLEGKGNLTINCSYKDYQNTINLVHYTITPIKGGNELSDKKHYDNEKTVTLTFDDLDCGEYIVVLKICFNKDLTLSSKGNCIYKTELVEIQNKRETIFNCVATENLNYVPVEYLFLDKTPVEFTEEIASYKLGGNLPSAEKIKNKPEGADFLGWYDKDNNKITKLPETSAKKVTVYAYFEKTVKDIKDVTDTKAIYNVIFPEEDYTIIEDFAFSNNSLLSKITIPSTVTKIGDSAFSSCSNLKSITFADGSQLTTIGDSAFSHCPALEEINIPESVTVIGDSAFYSCTELETIVIPDTVTKIEKYAFCGCKNLNKINLPANLTEIEEYAFLECSKIKEIIIPEKVTSLGKAAFMGCSAVNKLEIPVSVKTIGQGAFDGCTSLAEISIPYSAISNFENYLKKSTCSIKIFGVDLIEEGKFKDCYGLKEVEIASSATSIEKEAFKNCSYLEKITIPENVTSIGESAFQYCENLETVTFSGTSKLSSIGISAFQGCKRYLYSITIPKSVTTIGKQAFSNCDNLESVEFESGSNLKSIGAYAFAYCESLNECKIPAGVEKGENIFLETPLEE